MNPIEFFEKYWRVKGYKKPRKLRQWEKDFIDDCAKNEGRGIFALRRRDGSLVYYTKQRI